MKVLILLILLFSFAVPTYATDLSSESVSFYGSFEGPLLCTADCGNCCTGQKITERNKGFTARVRERDVELEKYFDDGINHMVQGFFYQDSGSCGINSCIFFKVTAIDSVNSKTDATRYNSKTGKLHIPDLVVDADKRFAVSLNAPYYLESFSEIMLQGEDCSGEYKQCDKGLNCLSYFGIAGSNGPEFHSCEIACKDNSVCPGNQNCITIADGPGQVCR